MNQLLVLAQNANVESFISGFDSEQRFVLAIIAISCLTLVLTVLGGILLNVWSSAKEKQIEADIKRDMLDRGMSAEEIKKVIEAAPQSGFDRWMTSWCKK